jgi:hypothetical protein
MAGRHSGVAPTRGGPTDAERFVPSSVDEEAAVSEITRLVEGLAPGGVDEATGHSLDNLINSTSARWEQEVQAEYAAYSARLTALVGVAGAAVAECAPAEEGDRERLADTRLALDAARARLVDAPVDGRGRFAAWGGRGHADPALLAGLPRVPLLLHTVALVAAIGADWAAFLQVVRLVMRTESAQTTMVVVAGFTGIVVYLAHAAGTLFRDLRAGAQSVTPALVALCVLAWAGFGAAAFAARLAVSRPPQAFGGTASTSQDNAMFAAVFFLTFYVGTGIVAGVGAYLTHNPLRAAYGRAARVHRRALRRAIASGRDLAMAEATRTAYAGELVAARQRLLHALQVRLALAERLKQIARVLIAQRAQDPAVTDAILEPDLRPYEWPPGAARTAS